MLYWHYHAEAQNTILLKLPIQFGRQSYCETRTTPYFAVPYQFRLSFTQRFFPSKGIYWWINLPMFSFTQDIMASKKQYLLDND